MTLRVSKLRVSYFNVPSSARMKLFRPVYRHDSVRKCSALTVGRRKHSTALKIVKGNTGDIMVLGFLLRVHVALPSVKHTFGCSLT